MHGETGKPPVSEEAISPQKLLSLIICAAEGLRERRGLQWGQKPRHFIVYIMHSSQLSLQDFITSVKSSYISGNMLAQAKRKTQEQKQTRRNAEVEGTKQQNISVGAD